MPTPVTDPKFLPGHVTRILVWKPVIETCAHNLDIHPSIIAAIISRETGGNEKNFLGDWETVKDESGKVIDKFPHGHGPMQVDDRTDKAFCKMWRDGKLSPEEGISRGCEILFSKQKEVSRLLKGLTKQDSLRASVAAYNCGTGNVKKSVLEGADIDKRTAHSNYSRDVIERAEFFAKGGF